GHRGQSIRPQEHLVVGRALARTARRRPRAVKLIVRTKAADPAHRRHALVPGREAAIGRAAEAPTMDGAPRIGIVGQGAVLAPAQATTRRASQARWFDYVSQTSFRERTIAPRNLPLRLM